MLIVDKRPQRVNSTSLLGDRIGLSDEFSREFKRLLTVHGLQARILSTNSRENFATSRKQKGQEGALKDDKGTRQKVI